MPPLVRLVRFPFVFLLTAFLAVPFGCTPTPKTDNGKVRLRVWSMWGGDEEKVFRRVLDEYNRTHPHVYLENLGSVDDNKTVRALVAGAPPDLFTIADPSNLGALAANDALLPLDDLFRDSGLSTDAFTRASLSQCRFRGKLYAMPYLVDCIVLLYNKQSFRDAGLDPERPPRTLEEMVEYCRKLTVRGPDGRLKRIGLRPPEAINLLAIYGGRYFDPETGTITATDPRHIEAVAMYQRLMEAQGGNEAVESFAQSFANQQGSYNPFYLGQVAMTFNGQWNTWWIQKYKPDVEYGIAPLPYPEKYPERAGTVWLGGNLFCIPKEGRHVREAWEFLRWTQTPEAQHLFADTIHGVPNIRASLADRSLRTGEPWREQFGKFMDLSDSPNATHFPPMPVAMLYLNEITNAVDAVRYGRKTPEGAMRSVGTRVRKEMDRYRTDGPKEVTR
ncbi:MAG: ABC transporter substrate-binding protein [Capsulimonadales bacterium]|nr:ABC transporter substrate-binding protein [Capsulimonadales bacterium]